MFYSVLIVGKPGACKTTSSGSILLEATKNGFQPQYESDRIRLENRVMQDTQHGSLIYDGSIAGPHSVLFDGTPPPGRKVFQVTDGTLLNEEHDKMIRIAMTHKNPEGVVLEYALGNDKHFINAPDFPLLQSGQSLLRRLSRFPVESERKIIILEVEAQFGKRVERNGFRIDGMKSETIEELFGDGCELQSFAGQLPQGISYYFIDNNPDGVEGLMQRIESFHRDIFRPVLQECRFSLLEGQPASTRERDRR